MKKFIFFMITSSMLALGGLNLNSVQVFAADTKTEEVEKEINSSTVSPIYSKNQIDGVSGYFAMNWTPGSTDDFGVSITNNSEEDKTYEISFNKGLTNPNGVIIYDSDEQNQIGEDPKISELIEVPDEVEVKAHSTYELKTKITYPNSDLNGYKLGGFTISEKTESDPNKQINQKVAYALPVILVGNKGITPEYKVEFGKFKFERIGTGIYAVNTPFKNENQNWMNEAKYKIVMKNSDGTEVLNNEKQISIAPETEVNFKEQFNKSLKSGVYEVTITITYQGKSWTETQKIELTGTQSKDVTATVTKKSPKWYSNIALDILIVLIVGILGYIIGKLSKRKKEVTSKDVKK